MNKAGRMYFPGGLQETVEVLACAAGNERGARASGCRQSRPWCAPVNGSKGKSRSPALHCGNQKTASWPTASTACAQPLPAGNRACGRHGRRPREKFFRESPTYRRGGMAGYSSHALICRSATLFSVIASMKRCARRLSVISGTAKSTALRRMV